MRMLSPPLILRSSQGTSTFLVLLMLGAACVFPQLALTGLSTTQLSPKHLHPKSSTSIAVGGSGGQALPPPALENTRWSLLLDVGRTTGSYMPLTWASDGMRLEIPLIVEFCQGGELRVLRVGEFLGEWTEPPESALGPLQQLGKFAADLPKPESPLVSPSISGGRWEMLEGEGGRLVQFNVETSGFQRKSIWLPKNKLNFKAKVYGQVLAAGKRPAFTICENLLSLGLIVAFLLGLQFGPAGWLSAVFFYFREVRISVGNWTCSRVEGDIDAEQMRPVTLTGDEPTRWQ